MCCNRFLVFMSLFCIGIAVDLPDGFIKCKRSDSDLNGCFKKAIENALPKLGKGVPELNFPQSQPIELTSLTIGEGKGPVQVVQKFNNLKVYNLIDAKVESVEVKIADTEANLTLKASLNNVTVDGEYDLNGRILVLPIAGTGPFKFIFDNVKVNLFLHAEELKKKEDVYFVIKDAKLDLDPEKITFDFKHLFNGDERLSDEMNKVLNENWREIWSDVGGGYEEALGLVVKDRANIIFGKIPHAVLFPQ